MNDLENSVLMQLKENSEQIAKELREFSATAQLLSDGEQRLINDHPLQWVGLYKSEVQCASTNLKTLMEQLAEKDIPASETIVRFIDKTQRTLIL